MEVQDSYVTTLDAEYLAAVKDLLNEDDNLRNETLQTMRQWISQQLHFNCRTDGYFLVTFARGCKFNLEEMKNKLEMYLTLKSTLPEFFTGWDPMKPELQSALEVGMQLPVPGYDIHGRKVVIIRIGCFDPRNHKPEDLEKSNFMVMECLANAEERVSFGGLVLLFDMEGLTMSHLIHKPLHMLKKQLKFIQEAVPCPPHAIIFIRTSTMFSGTLNMMQSMFNDNMKSKIHVLGYNFDNLHKMLSKEFLPSDYGGCSMSLKELSAHWKKQVEIQRDYLMAQEQYRSDESKRLTKPKNSFLGFWN